LAGVQPENKPIIQLKIIPTFSKGQNYSPLLGKTANQQLLESWMKFLFQPESEAEYIGRKGKNDNGCYDNQKNDKDIDGSLFQTLSYGFPSFHGLY
jgi:hypothetical protein